MDGGGTKSLPSVYIFISGAETGGVAEVVAVFAPRQSGTRRLAGRGVLGGWFPASFAQERERQAGEIGTAAGAAEHGVGDGLTRLR